MNEPTEEFVNLDRLEEWAIEDLETIVEPEYLEAIDD